MTSPFIRRIAVFIVAPWSGLEFGHYSSDEAALAQFLAERPARPHDSQAVSTMQIRIYARTRSASAVGHGAAAAMKEHGPAVRGGWPKRRVPHPCSVNIAEKRAIPPAPT